MVDAPEKIWAVFGNHGLLAFRDDRPHSVEYTRSDLVAELEAENERLKQAIADANADRDRWYESSFNATDRAERAEAKLADLSIVEAHCRTDLTHAEECLEDVLEQNKDLKNQLAEANKALDEIAALDDNSLHYGPVFARRAREAQGGENV